MMTRLVAVVAVLGLTAALAGPGWSQQPDDRGRVHGLWLAAIGGQPPDVVTAEIGRWYLSTLWALTARADVVGVGRVTAVSPLGQRARFDHDIPPQIQRYMPWLPPQTEPADAVAAVQLEEGLTGAATGATVYVFASAGVPVGERETTHPQFAVGERVALFLRRVSSPVQLPGDGYVTVSGLNGAWPLQWPGEQETPLWARDAEAVREVVAAESRSLEQQLQEARSWLQTDNIMLRGQGLICALAMPEAQRRQAIQDGFAWEYTRYSSLGLIWLLNNAELDTMVEAHFAAFPDTFGWLSLKIALPIIDRNWARRGGQ